MKAYNLRIKNIREATGLSRNQLVVLIGLHLTDKAHYTAFESGIIPPTDIQRLFVERVSEVLTGQLINKKPGMAPKGLSGNRPEIA